jgi:hypothetical protein
MKTKIADKNIETVTPPAPAPMIGASEFCRSSGISFTTLWRWSNQGWIKLTNINSRLYLTSEAIQEFKRRADAGEFAKVHPGKINIRSARSSVEAGV